MGASDGRFSIDDPHATLGPGATLDWFEQSPLCARAEMNYGPGGVGASLRDASVLGRHAHVGLRFDRGLLRRVTLFVCLSDDASGWDGWTLSQELKRKRAHDELAEALFGRTLLPSVIEIEGQAVWLGTDGTHPVHARFDWGEVLSAYDSKGGFSELQITYADHNAPV